MKLKKTVIYVVGLIVVLPGLMQLIGKGNIYSIEENRKRSEFPTVDEIGTDGFAAVRTWYDDNFGLRDVLIRTQHQIDYSFFKYSKTLFFSNDDGKEYLHYRSVIANEQINNEKMSEETRENIVETFRKIKEVLENQNIRFKFLVPPQKNEVLSSADEQMPVSRPSNNAYKVMERIFKEGELANNYVSVLDELIEQNAVAPVYYQTDFHWNDWGAAVAFGKVVNEFSKDLEMEYVYSLNDFEYTTFKPHYNDAQLASLSILNYNIPEEITVNKVLNNYSEGQKDERYPNYDIWINTETPVFDKAIMFIGDSYTPPALYSFNNTHNGIVELFPKVYFCHWDYAQGALLNIPDDVGFVVIESIESTYSYMDSKVGVLLEDANK